MEDFRTFDFQFTPKFAFGHRGWDRMRDAFGVSLAGGEVGLGWPCDSDDDNVRVVIASFPQ